MEIIGCDAEITNNFAFDSLMPLVIVMINDISDGSDD